VVSISKDIYHPTSKKSYINIIGPDVGKGLLVNMVVIDMNSSIVISDRLNVKGVGSSFARMDALNRHLRSETVAECARIVERGDWWRWWRWWCVRSI
jgi:hypothetical protein